MHLRPNLYFHEHTRLNVSSVLRCCMRVSSYCGYFFNGNCNRCARCLFLSCPGRFRNCGTSRLNHLGTCTLDPSTLAQLAASNVKPCRSMSKAHLGATQIIHYLREHFYEALEPTKGRPHAVPQLRRPPTNSINPLRPMTHMDTMSPQLAAKNFARSAGWR